jgi:DNA-binding response OmpR family regulator
LARIRAQLRQHERSDDAVLNIGSNTFRPGTKLLLNSSGTKIRLTEKETAILRYLLSRPPALDFARDILADQNRVDGGVPARCNANTPPWNVTFNS